MKDTYGRILKKVLAIYDPPTSSWRTLQATLASDLVKYSQTLPKSGMTQDGKLYELVTLGHRTAEKDFSLLLTPTAGAGEFHHRMRLLPTPKVGGQGTNPAEYLRVTPGLAAVVSLLPTPKVSGQGDKPNLYRGKAASLEEIFHLLLTPTAMHTRNHDEPIEAYQQRVEDYQQGKTKGKLGVSTGVALRWRNRNYRIHWITMEN